MTESLQNPVSKVVMLRSGVPLANVRKTPVVLRNLLIETVRQVYHPENTRLNPGLKYVWRPEPKKDFEDLWINGANVWQDREVDFRPAIYIKLAPIQYRSPVGPKHSGRSDYNMETGETSYCRIGEGSAAIVHIGHTMTETDELTSETFDFLDAFSDIIRADFCFDHFGVSQVVPATRAPKESREQFLGIVQVQFQFQDTWTIQHESPKLRDIVFRAGLCVANTLDSLSLD